MRRVPAILIVIFLALPLLSTALLSISVSTWVLDRGFYASLVGDERLYQFPDATSSATWWTGTIREFTGVGSRAATQAWREVLTPVYLRTQALGIVNHVFDFLEGGSTLDLTADLTPVKTALRGEPGRRFAAALAKSLPVGGAAAGFVTGAHTLPVSRPAAIPVDRAAAMIQAGLPAFAASIPDTVRLTDTVITPWAEISWTGGFNLLAGLIIADLVLLVFGCGLWLAAAFIGGETTFERLQWLGWVLFVPAVGVFLIGLVTMLGNAAGWAAWGIGQARLEAQGFSLSFVQALMDGARHVITRVGVGFLATGAVAAGIALALLAVSWSIPQAERSTTAGGSAPAGLSAPPTQGQGA